MKMYQKVQEVMTFVAISIFQIGEERAELLKIYV